MIGVCIPDKGDRPLFLENVKRIISSQTLQPDFVKVVDCTTMINYKIDITLRYEIGFKELFKRGCEVVIAIESDDWYSSDYIETMISEWEKAGKPDLFGIGESVYYHIGSRRYTVFQHEKRASMMSTMVTKKIIERHRFNIADPYLDYRLWTSGKFTKRTFIPEKRIAVGIKHGQGLVGGSGHNGDWTKYEHADSNYKLFDKMTGEDSAFYKIMAVKDNYEITEDSVLPDPFLTIITRVHGDGRPKGLARNMESVESLEGNWQQVFIKDKKGMGLHYANMSFMLATPLIKGKYVFLLDDDNIICNPNMIPYLEKVSEKHDPDVIVFRMYIRNGAFNNEYPSPQCWKERKPIMAHIGGTNMVIKAELFKKYIHHFGRPRCGDFYMLDKIYNEANAKWYWADCFMADTFGPPGHGKKENQTTTL